MAEDNPRNTPTKVEIDKGVLVVYPDSEGLTADRVYRIDEDFVDVGGTDEPRWIREDDIVAVGVSGDEDGLEVVLSGG